LQTLWERESTEFTPWLAKEENIQLLSKTIGIELKFKIKKHALDLLEQIFYVRMP